MRVLITGGRSFTDSALLFKTLDALVPRPTLIIEGGQRTFDPRTREIIGGADYWAKKWANQNDIEVLTIVANWRLHGRCAGPLRNGRLISMGRPDICVAFKGMSGTADCVRQASAAGVPVTKIAW